MIYLNWLKSLATKSDSEPSGNRSKVLPKKSTNHDLWCPQLIIIVGPTWAIGGEIHYFFSEYADAAFWAKSPSDVSQIVFLIHR